MDELLLEIGDTFELHKQQQEATTNTSTLVQGRTQFAVPKTEKEVVEARKPSVPKIKTDTKYCMFIFSNIHEPFPFFLYTLALATCVVIIMSTMSFNYVNIYYYCI